MAESKDQKRYEAACHAIQSGVAMEMELNTRGQGAASGETTPKHLRVGVNLALCGQAALAALLIEKGIITPEEYVRAQADQAERERERYEARLSNRLGAKITLA